MPTGNAYDTNPDLRPTEAVVLSLMWWEKFTSPARVLPGDRPDVVTGGYGATDRGLRVGQVVDRAGAESWLRDTVSVVGSAVARSTPVRLHQHQFDALVHFAYNVGMGDPGPPIVDGYLTSTMLRLINGMQLWSAALEFGRWRYSAGSELQGLVVRRQFEMGWFLGRTPLFDHLGEPRIPES